MLRGIPGAWADRVSEVILEVTPDSHLARIVMEEPDGTVTEYRFREQRENVRISDSLFRFVPPAGAEVIESDFDQ